MAHAEFAAGLDAMASTRPRRFLTSMTSPKPVYCVVLNLVTMFAALSNCDTEKSGTIYTRDSFVAVLVRIFGRGQPTDRPITVTAFLNSLLPGVIDYRPELVSRIPNQALFLKNIREDC